MVTDGLAAQVASQIAGGTHGPGSAIDARTASFNAAFEQAQLRQTQGSEDTQLATMLKPLFALGEQSAQLAADATPLTSNDFRPSELMLVTMRSHEFLFHCELVANVANRASDGVQQLFRQQS